MTDLTPKELDEARVKEAMRRGVITIPVKSTLAHLCDVFNAGWTPPPKVDPDLLAAREWVKVNTACGGPRVDMGAEDNLAEARAMLSASPPEPVSGWRDIATAPRDGTDILVYFSGRLRGVWKVSWENIHGDRTPTDGIWCVDDNKHVLNALRGYSAGDDTLWMPLPSPPEPGVK